MSSPVNDAYINIFFIFIIGPVESNHYYANFMVAPLYVLKDERLVESILIPMFRWWRKKIANISIEMKENWPLLEKLPVIYLEYLEYFGFNSDRYHI